MLFIGDHDVLMEFPFNSPLVLQQGRSTVGYMGKYLCVGIFEEPRPGVPR